MHTYWVMVLYYNNSFRRFCNGCKKRVAQFRKPKFATWAISNVCSWQPRSQWSFGYRLHITGGCVTTNMRMFASTIMSKYLYTWSYPYTSLRTFTNSTWPYSYYNYPVYVNTLYVYWLYESKLKKKQSVKPYKDQTDKKYCSILGPYFDFFNVN